MPGERQPADNYTLATMSTRKLIILALLCGIAILCAFALQVILMT
jgi:hypothetical protein